ncbi:hypothetical protein FCM35_KLT01835 [Carex littledalei]|uniref:Reverse transcriptase zinc-binding domain-containing protein n=1 Tax=Carex littledalei TaxID=544730 RepID=A0A833RBH8_9POAL|nr:hypothetical protein FCM35_KLT01835 [Carex littledalei]
MCVMCRQDAETARHMVGQCPFAVEIYRRIDMATEMRTQPIDAILRLEHNKKARGTLLVTMFVIWRERCTRIFRDTDKTHEQLIEEVAQLLHRRSDPAGEF